MKDRGHVKSGPENGQRVRSALNRTQAGEKRHEKTALGDPETVWLYDIWLRGQDLTTVEPAFVSQPEPSFARKD